LKSNWPAPSEAKSSAALPCRARLKHTSRPTLYAKVAGYLKTISVDKGDRVKEGDLIADIEVPEMLADFGQIQS